MSPQDRMEAVYATDPSIGRVRLAVAARVNQSTAKLFLRKKKGPSRPLEPAQIPPSNPLSNLSEFEQQLITKSLKAPPKTPPAACHWSNTSIKFAAIGGSHIGHIKAHQKWWDQMCSYIERERCEFALHTGDITEGMSGRDGHVYELEAIGASAQLDLAARRIAQVPCKVRGITGNHDLWGYKTIGFDPGSELGNRCANFEYLGQNEATIDVGGIQIMLSHPGDGSAYAISYALQQFINALSGGEKPHVLLMGHHHKSVFLQYRNIQAFETGTLCAQTGWMRGKKLQAHTGFWVIEVWPNAAGIERIKSEWVPFFG